jgi:hypothetical protein
MARALLVALLASILSLAPSRAAGANPEAAAPSDFMAELVARGFVRALLEGDIAAALPLCADEVSFDGERLRGKARVEPRLRQLAQRARFRGLQLVKIVVLTAQEAVRRYGPPPSRMRRSVPPQAMVALARFNHLGAAVVMVRQGGFWRVTALTD